MGYKIQLEDFQNQQGLQKVNKICTGAFFLFLFFLFFYDLLKIALCLIEA